MEAYFNGNTVLQYPSKQILPIHGKRGSIVIDNDYLAHLHDGDERIDFCFGNKNNRFNCVRFANCEVLSECVRSMAVFAQTVIIEDSSFDCEDLYFNLKNELEFRSGKFRFYSLKVEAKWVNIEHPCLMDGNQLIITASQSASLSGWLKLETQLLCRSQQISVDEHSSVSTIDILLFPTKSLEIRGALHSKKLFIGDFDKKQEKVVTGTARVELSGKVEADRVSIMSSNGVVLSGRVSVGELDCSSGKEVRVEGCRLKARKLQVHAQTTKVDTVSVLEGTQFSFLSEGNIMLANNLSSFQCDGLLVIECRSLLCLCGGGSTSSSSTASTSRCGDVYISAGKSIDLCGALKCKKLILKCQQRAANLLIRENANFDLDSLLVIGKRPAAAGSVADSDIDDRRSRAGEIVFDSGSVVKSSMFVAIEANKEVVIKGSLKRGDLCCCTPPPYLSITTSESIKFTVDCNVDVGGSRLLFGHELVLEDRANVSISGKLFLLHQNKNGGGVLRVAKDCVLVARKDIICRFGECYIQGTLASEEENILLGHNNNNRSSSSGPGPGGSGKKKLKQVMKRVAESLSSKPLLSIFNKVRDELIQNIRRIINLKEKEDEKSFVMDYIFVSSGGVIRAKKTVMLVSRDVTIQNGSSIKCSSDVFDSSGSAILIYSNRSVFQCSSELDASTVLIVSPIVFQLLSLIKAHNLSISAAVILRLACLCNSTKTILKSPLILSGLNVVAPNVSKTLHKMRSDLLEGFVDVVMLIEKLAEARMEHREFDVFLVESMALFKKKSHLALLHSLELVHFAFQIVNLLVPKTTALLITVNVMSIIRATLFLLFSVKNIRKSIKRYLTSERHNFILVEIVGEAMFSLYQVVGVVTSFTSLYNQTKSVHGMNSSSSVNIPTLKDLPLVIVNRTRDLVSSGPLSCLSNVLGVFDTFVLNDYTKYAVGLFSYLPSNMSFSILNLSGEVQLGMYVVNSSSACSLNGSVVVLSYSCSSTNIASFSPRSNVVICNGGIYETSTFGKVDRGVKISQRSLVLAGGRRVHDGGFHFGESVVLNLAKRFDQLNNRLIYNQIGGFSLKEWKLHQSEFRPVSHSSSSHSPVRMTGGSGLDAFDSDTIIESVDTSVLRSGNVIESVSVGDGSIFFLKGVALKMSNVTGAITVKNVQVKVSTGGQMRNLSVLQIAGGNNSFAFDADVNVNFSIRLAEGGHVSIVSPSTSVNCKTTGEGHIAFHNFADIGENASIQHTGSTSVELKDEQRLVDAVSGNGKYSKIANDGQVNFKVNGEFKLSAADEYEKMMFISETSVRQKQDLGVIATGSIDICRDVVRKKGIQLLSVEDDVVIRKSIASKDGSVIINSKHGNVIVEDVVEKTFIVRKCHPLKTKPSPVKSRLETGTVVSRPVPSSYNLTVVVVDGDSIVKNVERVELRAKDSVVISAHEGSIILDPCIIHGEEGVILEGKKGVSMNDICVTSVSHKNSSSGNPFYWKRKKVIKGVSETTSITSNGDISIIAAEGTIFTSGVHLTSNNGRILQSGRDGVHNESAVSKTSINEKVRVLGGLSREQRKEKHDVESPCVFESSEGIFVESERGSIVNVGVLASGTGVSSFKAKNVLFERRILKHEVTVKKQGFDLSFSILGADIFESSSTFFENLKLEFLENHLPPIGNSPIEVARSIREGNVPEIAANLVNALLIPGNLRFILDAPVKFGLKFNGYDLYHHTYDSLGEGKVEIDFLYINASDTVEFSNAFGFNAGSVEIVARKLVENGAYLNYEVENFTSGLGIGFEPFGGDLSHCVPSFSADLSISKESCSIAVCQVGNAAFMNVNVDEWDKLGSQTFAETIEGRVGSVSFHSTSTVAEGKRHGISLGTSSLGLSDGHSRSSLIADQTGLYSVNVDDFHVRSVYLKSSRCPVRGTDETSGEELTEFEKISATSLGVDFSDFVSLSVMAFFSGGGEGKQISKLKGVGIERKDYLAVVQNSTENVDESEFHYRVIDSSQSNDEREAMNNVASIHRNYETLTRSDNSLFVDEDIVADEKAVQRSSLLTPVKDVLKDRGFNLKIHYDRNYHLFQDGVEKMHKEVVDEGLLPCLEGAAFEDVDPQLMYPVLDIFYDPSTSELDKYTQMLFYRDGEKSRYCDLTEIEKQEVFIFQSYLQDGGDFRDFISLCNFYEERKQSLSDEYEKRSMKEYVRETYPELYLSTGLHEVQNVDEVRRVFMDIKFAYEPDDPTVRQLTFEMDQYYAEQIFDASWAELSSTQQKEVVKIREHALIYQQTDQEVDFSEFLIAKEAQFVDYFANHHQEPDTNILTSFGVLPIELLKEPDPILLECMPHQTQQHFNIERKYPVPGSGLFFLPAPPENGGWEGICEYGSTIKNCLRDHISYWLAGRPKVDYQPSQMEVLRDKSLRSFFSGLLDFIPYVNGAKWSYQGIAGFDPITKNSLDWKERVIDLTFSMFYFQPVANVIIGYGKGAVWEPMKGAWMAGKIIVKDRTLKGVFETMKITGSAAIESIAIPTQHLGAFFEMKMMWGVSNGASSFRSASSWFSNKMEGWKSGFWSKWKWSKRQFDVIKTCRYNHYPYANSGRDFAFAGSSPTFSGNCARHQNQPLRFAKKNNSKVGKGGIIVEKKKNVKMAKSDATKKKNVKMAKSDATKKKNAKKVKGEVTSPQKGTKKRKGIKGKSTESSSKSSDEVIFGSKIPSRGKRVPSSKGLRKGSAIMNRPKFSSSAKNYTIGRLRTKKIEVINGIHINKGSKYGKFLDNLRHLDYEHQDFILNLIASRLYSKIIRMLGEKSDTIRMKWPYVKNLGKKNVEFVRLPYISLDNYTEMAEHVSAKLKVTENLEITGGKRITAHQIKRFRNRYPDEIKRRIQKLSAANPQDGLYGLKSVQDRLALPEELLDFLVDLIAKSINKKIPKSREEFDFRKLDSTKALEGPSYSLNSKDLEVISKIFNADKRVKMNPGFRKNALQIRGVRSMKRLEILKNIRKMRGIDDKKNPLVIEKRFTTLSQECADSLAGIFAEVLLEKVPKHWDVRILNADDLPVLTPPEYEYIVEMHNAHPTVKENPEFERSVDLAEKFRVRNKDIILKKLRVMERKDENIRNEFGPFLKTRSAQLPLEYQEILVMEICKMVCSGIPKINKKRALTMFKMPKITFEQYETIARRYNSLPKVRRNPEFQRDLRQVSEFRHYHSDRVTEAIAELLQNHGVVKVIGREYTKHKLDAEHKAILVDVLANEMRSGMSAYELERLNVDDFPFLTPGGRERAALIYNKDVRVLEECQRSEEQIRKYQTDLMFQIFKRIKGEPVNFERFSKLPIEFVHIGLDIISRMIYLKIPQDTISIKKIPAMKFRYLPRLKYSEYEEITRRYNNDSRVKNTIYERPAEYFLRQVRVVHQWKKEILRKVQEMCQERGVFF